MNTSNLMMTIPKLNSRENWSTWRFAVKTFLQMEELWDVVDGTEKDARKDLKAKSKIILLLDPTLYVHVQEAQTAKDVWENLTKSFEDSGLLRRVGLLKDLVNTSLEASEDIEDYVNKIMSTAHKLRNVGFVVEDTWLATLLLAGLPEVYKPMIMGIESSGVKISADLIKNKLLQEVKTSDTTALYTNSNFKKMSYQVNNQQPFKGPGGPRCYRCGKYGHFSKNCWHTENNVKTDSGTDKNRFVAAFTGSTNSDTSSWYIDSGTSMHMTMHRDWLEEATAPPVKEIRIADNKKLRVECCGTVIIEIPTSNGGNNKIQVRDVLYVPDLTVNVLSVSKIIKSGCKVNFEINGCSIFNKNGNKVAQASLINNMYKLNTFKSTVDAMVTTTETDTYLWHQRMGHLNFNDVIKMTNCTSGVKLSSQRNNDVGTPCLEGKQTRQPFPNYGSRAKELLECIHTDVCGPMQTASIGGARYFVTFIDYFSRKVFVYFMKNKNEVIEKFKEFKNFVEDQKNPCFTK